MKSLDDLTADLATLQNKVNALQASVDAIQPPAPVDVSAQDATVVALSAQVDAMQAKLTPPAPTPTPTPTPGT